MSTAVFISYSHENVDFVNLLRKDLVAHGIRVWIDHENLAPGTPDWDEAIRVALRSVEAVLFVASPESRKSLFVRDELNVAQMYQRMIYPVWAAGEHWIDCVPIGWGATQYVDARGASYATALKALLGALGGAATPATTAMPPASPASTIITDPKELARKIEAAKESAQSHRATTAQSYDLSRLGELLAAADYPEAEDETIALLRAVAHVDVFDSREKVMRIPPDLLRQADAMWCSTWGLGLQHLEPVRDHRRGVSTSADWWLLETWLTRRLKELGLVRTLGGR